MGSLVEWGLQAQKASKHRRRWVTCGCSHSDNTRHTHQKEHSIDAIVRGLVLYRPSFLIFIFAGSPQ